MDRRMVPLTARVGGVSITVSVETRKAIRRMARAAAVVGGGVAGVTGVIMAGVAVTQSALALPVALCGIAAACIWRRCKG